MRSRKIAVDPSCYRSQGAVAEGSLEGEDSKTGHREVPWVAGDPHDPRLEDWTRVDRTGLVPSWAEPIPGRVVARPLSRRVAARKAARLPRMERERALVLDWNQTLSAEAEKPESSTRMAP